MIPPGAQAPCPAGARDDEATRLRRFVASVPNRISIGAARGAAPLSALLGLLLLGGAWTLRDHPGPGHEAAALCLLAAAALLMCLACLAAQRQERAVPRTRPRAPARPQPVGAAGPAGGRRPAPGGRGLVLRDSPRTARQGATGAIHAPARPVRRACRQRMPGRPTGSPAVPGWRLNGRNLSLLEAAEVIDLYLDIARAQARLRQLGEIPPSASSSLPTPRIFP